MIDCAGNIVDNALMPKYGQEGLAVVHDGRDRNIPFEQLENTNALPQPSVTPDQMDPLCGVWRVPQQNLSRTRLSAGTSCLVQHY